MELFIGNIPEDIDDYDLRKFFGIDDPLTRFRIIEKPGHNGTRIRYGIAEFESDRIARKVVVANNGRLWRAKKITVRTFMHRSYSNDRRALNWRQLDWQGEERRMYERRGRGRVAYNPSRDAVQMVAG